MTSKRRRLAKFVYTGFGFPVVLRDVAMLKTSIGRWAPQVDLNEVESAVFRGLALKPANLTGNEVRFIRQHMSMTLPSFAASLHVTHPAVLKWEGAASKPTSMSWGTELAIRLRILKDSGLTATEFFEAHSELDALELDHAAGAFLHYEVRGGVVRFESIGRRRRGKARSLKNR